MNVKEEICRILPLEIRKKMELLNLDYKELQEIRLRIGQPVFLKYRNQELRVDNRKEFKELFTESEMQEAIEYISHFSVYAYENEMKQGFITVVGGHRVGIAGKVYVEHNKVKRITNVAMLNIRVAHEVLGCSKKVLKHLWEQDEFCHTLIISPPSGGKTTLLRDLIRELAGDTYKLTVGLVDERSEVAACYKGVPQQKIGERCDVLDGCPKNDGIMMLLRSMAPEIIAVDELGGIEDIEAMQYARYCGCKLLATIHGGSLKEIKEKPQLKSFLEEGGFERYIVLGNKKSSGTIKEIWNKREEILL